MLIQFIILQNDLCLKHYIKSLVILSNQQNFIQAKMLVSINN